MTYRSNRQFIIGLTALASIGAACDRTPDARAADATRTSTAASGIVDSVFPPEEALRRFRAGLPVVSELAGAELTRDAIVRRFVRAVERNDTTTLREIVMTRPEFAHLYFPTSPHARPPAQQPPAVVWFLHTQNGEKGVGRALDRFGGRPMAFRGYTCASPARVEGENTIWDDCQLRLGTGGDTSTIRLFGGVIERAGRFKLLSYASDL